MVCGQELSTRLSAAVDGLIYISESDYPWEVVLAPSAGMGPVTPEELIALLGLGADTPFETRTLDQFFTPYLLSGDDGTRYADLRKLLEETLTAPQVVRLGMIQVQVYLVGRSACGEVAGVKTTSIET